MDKKWFYVLAFVITCVAFLLRVWPLQTAHWWDETVYLQHAEIISSGRTNYDEFLIRPPVLPILISGAYVFKHHIFSADILVAFLASIGIFCLCILGREIYDATTGIIAGLLLCFAPFFITASHWIMTDVPSLTFLIIGFTFLVFATKRKMPLLFVCSGFIFAIAMLTRFTALILLFVIPLFFILNKVPFKKLIPFALGFAVAIVPYFIWVQYKFGYFLITILSARSAVTDQVGTLTFYFQHFFEVYSLAICLGLVLYFFCVLTVMRPLVRKGRPIHITRLEVTLILWALLLIGYLSTVPHKEPRFILPAAAPLVLLAARGYGLLMQRKGMLRAITSVVLCAVLLLQLQPLLSTYTQPFTNRQETDPMLMSDYIVQHYSQTMIYANNDYPVYAYYTTYPVTVVAGDQLFLENYPKNMPVQGLFIMYTTVNKTPTDAWLQEHAEFQMVHHIGDIELYQYTPPR